MIHFIFTAIIDFANWRIQNLKRLEEEHLDYLIIKFYGKQGIVCVK